MESLESLVLFSATESYEKRNREALKIAKSVALSKGNERSALLLPCHKLWCWRAKFDENKEVDSRPILSLLPYKEKKTLQDSVQSAWTGCAFRC